MLGGARRRDPPQPRPDRRRWSRRTPRSRAPAPPSRPSSSTAPSIGVGHVGDSRGYLLRDGTLSQLTTDHTFVQSLIDEGRITEDEARVHPHRNLILRAVDGVHEPEPDVFTLEVAAGDRILLCSDGCSGVLADDDLARILARGHSRPRRRLPGQRRRSRPAAPTTSPSWSPTSSTTTPSTTPRPPRRRVTGPMLVGAAAERARAGAGSAAAGPRAARDTGELEPVADADGDGATSTPRRCATPRGRRAGSPGRAGSPSLAVIAAAARRSSAFAGYKWSQNQYYVADDGDDVAIYRASRPTCPASTPTTSRRPAPSRWTTCRLQRRARSATASAPAASTTPAASSARLQRLAPCPEPTPTPSRDAEPRRSHSQPPERDGHGRSTNRTPHGQRHPERRPRARQRHARRRPLHRDAMSSRAAEPHAPQGLMGFVHRRRRGAELVLLILSLVVGIGAYAAVGLGVDGHPAGQPVHVRRLAGRPGASPATS